MLTIFEKNVLRRMYQPKRDEMVSEVRFRMRYLIFCSVHPKVARGGKSRV